MEERRNDRRRRKNRKRENKKVQSSESFSKQEAENGKAKCTDRLLQKKLMPPYCKKNKDDKKEKRNKRKHQYDKKIKNYNTNIKTKEMQRAQ